MASKSIVNFAKNQAQYNPHMHKLCAVLYKGGSIIRHKFNTGQYIGYRTDIFDYEPTRHAEQAALHNVPRDILAGCSILVVRVNHKRQLVSAKPCKACLKAIQNAGITRLEYSNYVGEIVKVNAQSVEVDEWKKEIALHLRKN